MARANHTGSVGPDGGFTSNFSSGHPGAWRLAINDTTGALQRDLAPTRGLVADLFRAARYIAPSEMLGVARLQNPDDGKAPTPMNSAT